MTASSPNPAWPLRSDAENAGEPPVGCIHCLENRQYPSPPFPEPPFTQPTRRERAFDAAQRLVLSQPHMAIGQIEQNRLATYVLEVAARFEAWMAEPWIDLRTAADRVAAPQYAGFAQCEPLDKEVSFEDLLKASGLPDPAPADIADDAENAGQTSSFPLDGVTLPPGFKARPIVAGMDVASKSEMVSLHVSIRPAGLVEAIESVEALQKAVRSGELADASLESIKALLDLAKVDLSDLATFGADKLSLHFQPTEQYLRCVAAIAARDVERHVIRVKFRHGWPILSVESRFPTVAEGAAPANAAPEAGQ